MGGETCVWRRKERDRCIWTNGGLVCKVEKGEIEICGESEQERDDNWGRGVTRERGEKGDGWQGRGVTRGRGDITCVWYSRTGISSCGEGPNWRRTAEYLHTGNMQERWHVSLDQLLRDTCVYIPDSNTHSQTQVDHTHACDTHTPWRQCPQRCSKPLTGILCGVTGIILKCVCVCVYVHVCACMRACVCVQGRATHWSPWKA